MKYAASGTWSIFAFPVVIDGAALRIDDKLRVAKERREEQEKQQGGSYILFCHTCCAFLLQALEAACV